MPGFSGDKPTGIARLGFQAQAIMVAGNGLRADAGTGAKTDFPSG